MKKYEIKALDKTTQEEKPKTKRQKEKEIALNEYLKENNITRDDLMTIDEIIESLKCSKTRAYYLIRFIGIEKIVIDKATYYHKSDLDKLINWRESMTEEGREAYRKKVRDGNYSAGSVVEFIRQRKLPEEKFEEVKTINPDYWYIWVGPQFYDVPPKQLKDSIYYPNLEYMGVHLSRGEIKVYREREQ